jgi:hypothetical protein
MKRELKVKLLRMLEKIWRIGKAYDLEVGDILEIFWR